MILQRWNRRGSGAGRPGQRSLSPSVVISTVALFVALSGTAFAATGGNFILGKANTAGAVSSLANSNGTALSLSSKAGTAPLTVSNSVRVPNLNASLLGGQPASAFLGVNGTASNAKELGGILPDGFMQGCCYSTSNSFALLTTSPGATIIATHDNQFSIGGECVSAGTTGSMLFANPNGETSIWVWQGGANGSMYASSLKTNSTFDINGGIASEFEDVSGQIFAGSRVVSFWVSAYVDTSGAQPECFFAGQMLDNA